MPKKDIKKVKKRGLKDPGSKNLMTSENTQDLQEDENGFRSLIENAVIGIYRTNENGDFLFANRRLAQIFGFKTEMDFLESLPNAVQLYVAPEERDRLLNILNAQGFIDGFETRFKRRDGEGVWISVRARVIKGMSGTILYEGFILDITDKKEAQFALQESEKRFRLLVEQAGDAFFIHDYTGRILDVNLRACEILGYNKDELLGMGMSDVDLEIAKEQHKDRYWTPLQSEKYITFEGMHRRKNGSTFPVEVRLGRVDLRGQVSASFPYKRCYRTKEIGR